MNNARLIQADDVDRVGQQLLAETSRLGALELHGYAVAVRETRELAFHAADRMPVPGHQQQHGDIGPK